jgi:hypothetical protein
MYSKSIYDAEKYDKCGCGTRYITVYCDRFKDDIDENGECIKTKEEKAQEELISIITEQKKKNHEYRLNNPKNKLNVIKISEKPMKGTPVPIDTILKDRKVTLDINFDNLGSNQWTCLVLGSSKRGKSTLIEYLFDKYYDNKKFITTLFSINSQIQLYKPFVNSKHAIVCGIFDKRCEKYIELQHYINKKCDNKYNFLNIFDDCLEMQYKKLINNLILTYRNSNMSTILSLQYLYLVPKMIRANANSILLFGFNSDESIENVCKTYLSSHFNKMGYKTLPEKVELYKQLTDDHGFIYLNPLSDTISFHRLSI